jgi:CubicO group peptidase (beta-lactamase class C family)
MKNYILTVSLFAIINYATGQSYQPPVFTDTDRLKKIEAILPAIDKIYQDYAEKNHFPGFVYGIVVDGKLIHTGQSGYTDLSKKIVATAQSEFRIASMSKSFTTMAIMKLRDAGKLNLDDPAEKYIPQMKKIKPLTIDAPAITIRHLLTHAAGFPEDNPWGDRQLADTNQELLQLVSNAAFSNVPGVAYEYSNLGITLLGYIINKITGQPYQKYINEQIIKPLGMTHTHWEYADVPADKLSHGYRWQDDQWLEEALLHDGAYGAMGGLITSVEDFSKYMALHIAAWPPKNDLDTGPLKRSSLREMHQPWNISAFNPTYKYPNGRACGIVTAYCYGLNWLRDCDNRVYVGHSGGLPGFGSHWRFLPEYGVGVVSMANRTYAPAGLVNLQVLDTLIIGAQLKPRTLPPSDILKKRQNELVKLLPDWKNAEKSGIFAENFFADYVIDALRKESKSVFEKVGKILTVKDLIPENQLRGAFMLIGEKADISVSFTLTPESQPLIQEYHIREVEKTRR